MAFPQPVIFPQITAAHIAPATKEKPAICFALEEMINIGNLEDVNTETDKNRYRPVSAECLQASEVNVGVDGYPHYTRIHMGSFSYNMDGRDEAKLLVEMELGIKPQPYGTVLYLVS